ncbi:TetR-like C-terminal domain-containing protein [Intestinimonas timonensis]|uniref:TetR-like C-terminal domain-containing protein n=1 Tax=Intestinimonas timonensis TaxID=1689270 RepID=UPI001F5EABE0|nr:TetR-like C-terminal domain-containing protein [Intestinimonas timonensis]
MQIKGQNSFSDHFQEYIRPFIAARISSLFGEEQVDEFILDFFCDAGGDLYHGALAADQRVYAARAVCGKT